MKKLLFLITLFVMCEIVSHSQTRTPILSTIDAKVINNPSSPLRAADLNAILKSIVNFQDSISLDVRYLKIHDTSAFIQKQTQNPTVAISTATNALELMSTGSDLTASFFCTVGRLAATPTANATASIVSVTLNGSPVTLIYPSAGNSSSASVDVTYPRNTNTTFTLVATSSDGKTASISTSIVFQPKRYWFYSTSATPGSSDVLAALGGGSELSTSNAKSGFTITPSGGNRYLSYAYPSSEGALSSIVLTFESIGSFTPRTVSVTNASGYVQNYYVYTSNNQLPTTTIKNVN